MLKVFTDRACQPCKLAKKQLEDRLIDFEEFDVAEKEGLSKAKEMGVDGGLPYFVYGDRRFAGWIGSVDALIEYLEMS
jgi:glutaredoxin